MHTQSKFVRLLTCGLSINYKSVIHDEALQFGIHFVHDFIGIYPSVQLQWYVLENLTIETRISLKLKGRYFDELFITGCNGGHHHDNLRCAPSDWNIPQSRNQPFHFSVHPFQSYMYEPWLGTHIIKHLRFSVLETKAGPSVRDRQLLVRTSNFLHISLQIDVWISQNFAQDRQLFQLSLEHWFILNHCGDIIVLANSCLFTDKNLDWVFLRAIS